MITIQALLDDKLKAKDEQKRIRSHKFSPSSFGYCYRKQIFNRQDVPKTNPPDARSLRIFACGNLFHDFVQQFFPDAQTEVLVELDDLKGYADIVRDDEVVDIKSCHSGQFNYLCTPGYDIATEKYSNIIQLMAYALYLGKPRGRLVFVSKDDLRIEEFPFFTEKWKDQVELELQTLRSYWNLGAGQLPPPVPRAFIDGVDKFKECRKYCAWRDHCVALGHVIPPEPKKAYKRKAKV